MCKYCDAATIKQVKDDYNTGEKTWEDVLDYSVVNSPDGYTAYFTDRTGIDEDGHKVRYVPFAFEYCPMCGRKLKE